MSRPTGITILGILYILGSIGGLIAAIGFGAMSTMMGSTNSMMVVMEWIPVLMMLQGIM